MTSKSEVFTQCLLLATRPAYILYLIFALDKHLIRKGQLKYRDKKNQLKYVSPPYTIYNV